MEEPFHDPFTFAVHCRVTSHEQLSLAGEDCLVLSGLEEFSGE